MLLPIQENKLNVRYLDFAGQIKSFRAVCFACLVFINNNNSNNYSFSVSNFSAAKQVLAQAKWTAATLQIQIR